MKPYFSGMDEALDAIFEEVKAVAEYPEKHHKEVLKKIGEAVKKNVVAVSNAVRSDEDQIHIADDVTIKVSRTKNKQPYVSVKGGRLTGYKWIFVNDGHYAANGKFVPGNHFVDIAAQASEHEVDTIVDAYMKEVAAAKGD